MEVLVLGASGMAGHVISIYLQEKGVQVTGFARTLLPYCETIVGDALNKEAIRAAVTSKPYDAVVNCIGVLNQDVDRHLANGIFLNSYLPHYVAECLAKTPTRLIHISTDCVFSGKDGNYVENSEKDSYTPYGMSKSLGEVNDSKNLTFRTSIIGPDLKEDGIGLLNWFLRQKGAVSGYTSAIWSGVSTFTLAQAIEVALSTDKLCGLYHLVNNEKISKFDLLQLFNSHIRKESIEIIRNESVKVDKSLINTRVDFAFSVPSYEQMIMDTKKWLTDHEELYPHYFQ